MTDLPFPDLVSQGTRKCLTVPDPDIFFAEMDMPRTEEAKVLTQEAKEVCSDCVYKTDCALWALMNPDERGVWGGMSEEDRRTARRRAIKKNQRLSAYA